MEEARGNGNGKPGEHVVIWWIGLVVWMSIGLSGLAWLPPSHPSWSRRARLVLQAFFVFALAMLGPLGLWQMIRLDRQERRIGGARLRGR
jgi:hypothetical protein